MQPIVITKTILPISDVVSITEAEPSPTNKPDHAANVAESVVDEIMLVPQYQVLCRMSVLVNPDA